MSVLRLAEQHGRKVARVGLSEEISEFSVTSSAKGLWQRYGVRVRVRVLDGSGIPIRYLSVASGELPRLYVWLAPGHLVIDVYGV